MKKFINKKTILIWRFEDAPEEFQKLSQFCGDETWIAFVPDSLSDEYIGWLTDGASFAPCSIEEFKIKDGIIKIGCH